MSSFHYQKLEPLPRWMRWLGAIIVAGPLVLVLVRLFSQSAFRPVEGIL